MLDTDEKLESIWKSGRRVFVLCFLVTSEFKYFLFINICLTNYQFIAFVLILSSYQYKGAITTF